MVARGDLANWSLRIEPNCTFTHLRYARGTAPEGLRPTAAPMVPPMMTLLLAAAVLAAPAAAPDAGGASLYFSATGVSKLDTAPVFVWLRDTACERCNRSLLYTLQGAAQPAGSLLVAPSVVELSVSRCNLTEASCAVWHNATTRFSDGGVRRALRPAFAPHTPCRVSEERSSLSLTRADASPRRCIHCPSRTRRFPRRPRRPRRPRHRHAPRRALRHRRPRRHRRTLRHRTLLRRRHRHRRHRRRRQRT
jgi:hypothetical protein